jgi:putative oxidoreductase
MGLPMLVAVLVVAAEFLGAIGLVVGFLTRIAAAGIFAVMIGAIAMVHLKYGFFMNWFGKQAGEGIEYHLLAIAISLALVLGGGGMASIDRALTRR